MRVRKILFSDAEIYTSSISLAEVISRTKRKEKDVAIAYSAILRNSFIIPVDEILGKEVGLIHAEVRKRKKDFGLAGAFILSTARRLKAKILTGDPHFKGFKEVIFIK